MSNCWYCYWGWPEQTANIYSRYEKLLRMLSDRYKEHESLPDLAAAFTLNYGPGHIVWEDENFDCAQWCLDEATNNFSEWPKKIMALHKRALRELLRLPGWLINLEPEEYQSGEGSVEEWPPPIGVKMIHI